MVEALRIADRLPGGLTRANFILSLRSLDIYHPLMMDGIEMSISGNADAFFIEGSEFNRFDSSTQSWYIEGTAYDINGQTPNCRWSVYYGGCR
jgi:hypothetical protein